MKVLVIEDDDTTRNYLLKGLHEAGHSADGAADGAQGLLMANTGTESPGGMNYDAIVVDRMLPILDGLGVISALRKGGCTLPILILSARGEVDERVEGLRCGADDYLVKPFAFIELLARLEALQRRGDTEPQKTELQVGDLELNLLTRTAQRAGQDIKLQPREYRLLEFLMRRAGQVVTRTMLLEGVWDYHFDPQTNVIDVHISRLRQKIDKHFSQPMLHTVRGAGYILEAAASATADIATPNAA